MHSFRNAKWSWPITVIPVCVFIWIHYGTYRIIHEQLSWQDSNQWMLYGGLLSLLWLIHTGITSYLILIRCPLEKNYGYITFALYFLFVFIYLSNFYNMIPPSIPGWVASENKRLYAMIFIAPTLVHSLAIINTNIDTQTKPILKEKLLTIGIALAGCILLLMILPKAQRGLEHKIVIFMFLLSSASFLNGVTKLFDLNRLKSFFVKEKYIMIAKPLLAVSFPLAGMFLNNDILFDAGLGNFSNLSFYIWSILNGFATCAPDFKHRVYRVVLFLVRSMTYSYIIWLMITFMPRLPLSAIAISSFGLGYLMVAPLVIIIFHTKLLVSDATYLYHHLSRQTIRAMFLTAASLPIIVNTFEALYTQ